MRGPPILGTAICVPLLLSVLATSMACTTALVTLTAAWAIAYIILSCMVAILDLLSICLEIAFVTLPYLSLPNFLLLM